MKHVLPESTTNPLQKSGYVRFNLWLEFSDSLLAHFSEVKEEFSHMPIDNYAKDSNRYRRYSRGIILPWTKEFHWLPNYHPDFAEPICEYYQGSFNSEYMETYRAFSPLSEKIKSNHLLQEIIRYDYKQTFWNSRELTMPIHVGVHFVRMEVNDPQKVSVASPNYVHQDGEPFTFCHLVERTNVFGGTNLIATPECIEKQRHEVLPEQIHAEFELHKPLESYGVCDSMVSHYVSGVRMKDQGTPAIRSVILIDYVPTILSIT